MVIQNFEEKNREFAGFLGETNSKCSKIRFGSNFRYSLKPIKFLHQ